MGANKLSCGHWGGQKRCAQCFFARNKLALCEEFPWLHVSQDEPFAVGCSVCQKFYRENGVEKAASHGGSWANGAVTQHRAMQRRALMTHEASDSHQKACGHVEASPETIAPSTNQFKALLNHAQKHPIGSGLSNVGGQKKCRKMLWCLAESNRIRKRQLWKSRGPSAQGFISSTTLFQDARKGRLTVRFTAANSRCERLMGHMGTVSIAADLTAVGLMEGLCGIVEAFCTPCRFPPHLEKAHSPVLDRELHQALVKSIETFISDAASDEIRAGHMLAGQSTTSMHLPHLPNLRVVSRDKPHGTRRTISRGWKADSFLDDVIQSFVFGPSSPTRLIQWSQAFKDIFAANVRRQDSSISAVKAHQHMKDLGFAAHRFESAAKPLTRIVLFFPAFLSTVVQISNERKGNEEGRAASSFLDWLTAEKCLQMSMLADCAIENLELTRLVDFQGFPLEELPVKVLAFRDRVNALFASTPPACVSTGCTEQMLKILKRPLVLIYAGPGGRQTTKQLGCLTGVSDVVTATCLQRMAHWVRLCEATLQSEFPHFDTLRAFAVFNVKDLASEAIPSRTVRMTCLSRLQKAFHLEDSPLASEQLEKLWHCARRISSEEGLGSADAWIKAVLHATRAWSRPNVKEILQALVRFWAAGASTSGVEQSFSRARGLCDNLMVMDHVNDVMEVGTNPLSFPERFRFGF